MPSGKENISDEVVIEDNYNGKRREGRVTFPTNLQGVVDHVESGFKSQGFKVRYLSRLTMEVERGFSYEKPVAKIGMVELDFFEYADHSVVYYKVFNSMGLSSVTLSVIIIYGFTALTWLSKYHGSPDAWKVVIPFILFLAIFIYQRLSNFKTIKGIIKHVMVTYDN